ncbi:DUF3368 domain-containing protein [[Phormidium] sp. ETS-05]
MGILLVAKRRGWVTAIRPILDNLIEEAGFRLRDSLYAEALAAAGE